jgi:hypothetical protein
MLITQTRLEETMAKFSVKEEIARRLARKSVEDRVYEALNQFEEDEFDAVKKVLVDILRLQASSAPAAKAAVVADAPKKEDKEREIKFAPTAPAKAKTRGRKPGSKNKVKVAAESAAVVAEKKSSSRGRKGKYPTLHEDKLRDAVCDILKAHDGSLSQKEIREYLCQGAYSEHRENKAFQSRISSLLARWCDEGVLAKPARGVYELKH